MADTATNTQAMAKTRTSSAMIAGNVRLATPTANSPSETPTAIADSNGHPMRSGMNSRTVEAKLAGSASLAPPATISRHATAVLAQRTRTSTGLHPGPDCAAREAAAGREIFRPEREMRKLQQLRHLPGLIYQARCPHPASGVDKYRKRCHPDVICGIERR